MAIQKVTLDATNVASVSLTPLTPVPTLYIRCESTWIEYALHVFGYLIEKAPSFYGGSLRLHTQQ